MTTITGFTSARMLGIENNTVVSGAIVGDDLILTKHDASTVNAGDVRGPVGPQGPVGEVTTAELNAAISVVDGDIATNAADIATNAADIATNAADISAVEVLAGYAADRVPAGLVSMTMATSIPNGWLAIEGQSVASCDTLYPELWAAAPAGWQSGTTLNLPDMRGRMPVGQSVTDPMFDVLTSTGGQASVTLSKSNVPKHYHEMDHNHTSATTTSDSHNHTIDHNHPSTNTTNYSHTHSTNSGLPVVYQGSGGTLGLADGAVWGGVYGAPLNVGTVLSASTDTHNHTVNIPTMGGSSSTESHTHNLDLPNYIGNTEDGSETGLGNDPIETVSPYFVLRFIIKT